MVTYSDADINRLFSVVFVAGITDIQNYIGLDVLHHVTAIHNAPMHQCANVQYTVPITQCALRNS